MAKKWTKEQAKYKCISLVQDSWIVVLTTISLSTIFLFNFNIANWLLACMIFAIVANFVYLIFFSKIRYKTKQGVKVVCRREYIEKKVMDDFFDDVANKWRAVLRYDRKKRVLEELAKLKFIFVKPEFKIVVNPFYNEVYWPGDIVRDKKVAEEYCHDFISKKIFPSFTHSFRRTIMKRFKII